MEDNNETLQPETEQFEDGLETNLVNIARIIFSRPPQPPYSIQLQLDDGSISQNQHDTKTIINEMSLTFVPVGPVKMRSPIFEKKLYESLSAKNF